MDVEKLGEMVYGEIKLDLMTQMELGKEIREDKCGAVWEIC